jgi:hypothetical protein
MEVQNSRWKCLTKHVYNHTMPGFVAVDHAQIQITSGQVGVPASLTTLNKGTTCSLGLHEARKFPFHISILKIYIRKRNTILTIQGSFHHPSWLSHLKGNNPYNTLDPMHNSDSPGTASFLWDIGQLVTKSLSRCSHLCISSTSTLLHTGTR